MTRFKKVLMSILIAGLLAGAFVGFNGCSQESPLAVSPTNESASPVMSDQGPIYLVEVSPNESHQLQKNLPGVLFSVKKFIPAEIGGDLMVGDILSGFSSITFHPFDLPQDTLITFDWIAGNTLEATLTPHGIIFNNPVQLTLSYKSANISMADEDNLRIYYYNEETQTWELVGGTVNKVTKTVTGYINHFSRYALARS